jgi:hypothetical protein
MKRILSFATLFVIFLAAFAGTAFAAGAVAPADGSLLDLARPIFDAVMHGQYWIAASLALVMLTALARKYGTGKLPFLATGAGAAILVLVGSFGGALATALLAGSAISLGLAFTALKVAFAAAGGFSLAKSLVAPLLRKIQAKAPIWAQPIFGILFWAFERPEALATAEAAGAAAVKAAPAKGAAGVLKKAPKAVK